MPPPTTLVGMRNHGGSGDFGETDPSLDTTNAEGYPISDCDFVDGFPGECEPVPIALDPLTECVTFTLEEISAPEAPAARGCWRPGWRWWPEVLAA